MNDDDTPNEFDQIAAGIRDGGLITGPMPEQLSSGPPKSLIDAIKAGRITVIGPPGDAEYPFAKEYPDVDSLPEMNDGEQRTAELMARLGMSPEKAASYRLAAWQQFGPPENWPGVIEAGRERMTEMFDQKAEQPWIDPREPGALILGEVIEPNQADDEYLGLKDATMQAMAALTALDALVGMDEPVAIAEVVLTTHDSRDGMWSISRDSEGYWTLNRTVES